MSSSNALLVVMSFINNIANEWGGAISAHSGAVTLQGCSFAENEAPANKGPDIYRSNEGTWHQRLPINGCPEGFTTSQGVALSIDVASGSALTGYSYTCATCTTPGQSTTSAGATSCSYCPAGKTTLGPGYPCQTCQAGRFAASTGSLGCSLCPISKYNADDGDDPANHDQVGDCTNCAAGKYGDKVGTTICPNCAAGKISGAGGERVSETRCFSYSTFLYQHNSQPRLAQTVRLASTTRCLAPPPAQTVAWGSTSVPPARPRDTIVRAVPLERTRAVLERLLARIAKLATTRAALGRSPAPSAPLERLIRPPVNLPAPTARSAAISSLLEALERARPAPLAP